jgi:hypothetical protein
MIKKSVNKEENLPNYFNNGIVQIINNLLQLSNFEIRKS